MYTEKEFKTRWRKLHHPSMNVDGDVSFYYGVYKQLHGIVKGNAKNKDENCLFQILMYTENTVSISVDSFYGTMYRSVGNIVVYWCDKLGVSTEDANLIYRCVTEAVAGAPGSSLIEWIKDCVLSVDFQRLKDVALYFAIQDKAISRIYPNFKYRKDAFVELAGSDNKAKEMLESDLAFNWRDKEGVTLLSRIAESFNRDKDGKEVAANLGTIRPLPLDSYLPLEVKDDGRTVAMMKKDNAVLDVIFPSRVSKKKIDGMCFVGQLVSYLGKTYVNGPVVWLDISAFDLWDGDIFWSSIYENEEESSKHECFTTAYGKKYSRHQDLYGEFEKDENGFYTDEPNFFDFLNWLAPVSK